VQLLALAVRDPDEGAARAAQVSDVEHALRRGDVRHLRYLLCSIHAQKRWWLDSNTLFVIARVASTAVADITNYLEVPAGDGDVLE
jgi:hypothetical protein